MPEYTQHEPSTFSWADLATDDVDAAKRFYGELFGWAAQDMPAGDSGEIYSMTFKEDKSVGAICQAREEEGPPHWNAYFTVESADAAAERAKEFGAEVVAGPFDVFDAGRMATIRDPQGVFVSVWEPGKHIGSQLLHEHGALTWFELLTSDVDASIEFYSAFFGWKPVASENIPDYTTFTTSKGTITGGVRALGDDMAHVPPHWSVCFMVDDVDAAMETATANGGQVLVPAASMPIGRFGVLADPAGAPVPIFTAA